MKRTKKKKNGMFSLLVAAALLLSVTNLNAKNRPGGLFGGDYSAEHNQGGLLRDVNPSEGVLGLGGAETENPTPLGGGIIILMAAGAGYAMLKRKEDKQ